ncbi:hypothetical protein ACQKKK_16545 [Peribacillus sp. NPDC006672]
MPTVLEDLYVKDFIPLLALAYPEAVQDLSRRLSYAGVYAFRS